MADSIMNKQKILRMLVMFFIVVSLAGFVSAKNATTAYTDGNDVFLDLICLDLQSCSDETTGTGYVDCSSEGGNPNEEVLHNLSLNTNGSYAKAKLKIQDVCWNGGTYYAKVDINTEEAFCSAGDCSGWGCIDVDCDYYEEIYEQIIPQLFFCDDGSTQPCFPPFSAGVCADAIQICEDGKWTGDCNSFGYEQDTELTCADGLDNDCDGTTDCDDATNCGTDPHCMDTDVDGVSDADDLCPSTPVDDNSDEVDEDGCIDFDDWEEERFCQEEGFSDSYYLFGTSSYDGVSSAQLIITDQLDGESSLGNPLTFIPGDEYTLSFYYKFEPSVPPGEKAKVIFQKTKTNPQIYSEFDLTSSPGWEYFEEQFTAPASTAYVRFVLGDAIGADCDGANQFTTNPRLSLDKVSLQKSEDIDVVYSDPPTSIAEAGCCPDDYCWTGDTCTPASEYMENTETHSHSQKAPLWNDYTRLWGIQFSDDSNEHIDYKDLYLARGFRCIINTTTQKAEWRIQNISYDFDRIKSGYCNEETECFASSGDWNSMWQESNDCVPHGTHGQLGQGWDYTRGDHYCNNGEWTTRTHLAAAILMRIKEENPAVQDYTLFCSDREHALNEKVALNLTYTFETENYCVLNMSVSGKERVYIATPTNMQRDHFLTDVHSMYNMFYDPNYAVTPSCSQIGLSNFDKCWEAEASYGEGKLYLYFYNPAKIAIFSNEEVNLFEDSLFEVIVNFFKNLFGYSTEISEDFDFLDFTEGFDELYLYKKEGGFFENPKNITGIKESTYDEVSDDMSEFIQVNYTGFALSKEILNMGIVTDKSNASVFKQNYDDHSLTVKGPTQDFWSYLSAVLRPQQCGDEDDDDGDGFYKKDSDCSIANDCDDTDSEIRPGALEICGNGKDENCDGIYADCDACEIDEEIPETGCECDGADYYDGYCCDSGYSIAACNQL